MTDVLLIQPPIRDFYLTAKRTIPYGLACIASALAEEGFSVEILDCLATSKSKRIDYPPEMDYLKEYYGKPDISPFSLFHQFKHYGYGYERIGEAARKSGAWMVGISSLFTAYSDEALKTAEAVKAAVPACRVVLGGHHPTEMYEEVMRRGAVDCVIRGEGEAAMPVLARAIKNGNDLSSIPGVVSRSPDGGISVNPPAVVTDLDRLLPAFSLVDHRFYRRAAGASWVVAASRGCPMKCTYCSVGASSGIPYRRRSVESVMREIHEAVTRFEVGFIDFEDENVSLDRKWFMELLSGILERYGDHGPELRAMNGLFPPSLDAEVIRSMKKAGFRALNLSLGSTSGEQLRKFRRPDVRRAFDEALFHAEESDLDAVGYIIVGAPGQCAKDSLDDLLYLARRRVLAGVSVYYPSPGSIDYARCRDAGVLPKSFPLMRSTALPISHTTTRDESITLLRLGRILNFAKSLIDRGEPLPPPCPFKPSDLPSLDERHAVGRTLFSWFLHDGAIRGVTPAGEIYEHRGSRELSREFASRLRETGIRGAHHSPARA